MKIVCLGDSLTYGYGTPRKDCWVSVSAQRTGFELVNRGINGDTTGGMLARFREQVLAAQPRRVMLLGGANDILTSGTDLNARSNLAAMVYQAVDAGVTPMVGLYPPYLPALADPLKLPVLIEEDLTPVFAAYRDWCIRLAQRKGVQLVDFAQGFTGPDCYQDDVHPNVKGHGIMASVFCAAVKK